MTDHAKLKRERFARVLAAIERWEAKERRARNALRKLRKQRAYYLKALGGRPKAEPAPIGKNERQFKRWAGAIYKAKKQAGLLDARQS